MNLSPGLRSVRAVAVLIAGTLLLISPVAAAPVNPAAPVVTQGAVPVQTEVPAAAAFNPAAPPQPQAGKVVEVKLDAMRAKLEIAPGEFQEVWTFNGQVPAPTIRVHQGDTVRITLANKDPEMAHGLDFHAGQMDSGTFHKPINPGESETFTFKADYPGVFYYHCSAGPVIMHIANGMFGAVIVDPPGYTPAGREYVLIQHEWYDKLTDLNSLLSGTPRAMAFNGVPSQYLNAPLTAAPGEPVRFYFIDAGPNHFSAFHVIGTIFDKVYQDGNPANVLYGVQTIAVPPGGAVITDLVADTGTYPILTHVMKDATIGALGLLKVGSPDAGHDPSSHGGGGTTPSPTPTPNPAPTPAPAPADGHTISMATFMFSPSVLTVQAGTTVTWVNNEDVEHTVADADAATAADRQFDSSGQNEGKAMQMMKKGDTFAHTFTAAGTYHYKCLVHPFMTGTIVVK
jgi:nitrite reductase (NO-forming)